MPQRTPLGNSPDLERAITRATLLAHGEALVIWLESEQECETVRQLFLRMRRRAIKDALSNAEIAPGDADPWAGLHTQIVWGEAGEVGLRINRPRKVEFVTIIAADGSAKEEAV